jgi:hypothetical protein
MIQTDLFNEVLNNKQKGWWVGEKLLLVNSGVLALDSKQNYESFVAFVSS